jgi:hypothetical protein
MRTLRTYIVALIAVPAIALALPDGSSAESARKTVHIDVGMVEAIRHYRATTRRLQSVMDHRVVRLTPLRHASLRRVHTVWRKRAVTVKRRFEAGPRHRRGWMCIHRYEGAWSDDRSPYYGGLQMDIGFQRHYGGMLFRAKGTADNWTPLEQMWVAERAHRSGRGFYPWRNTARTCGLI